MTDEELGDALHSLVEDRCGYPVNGGFYLVSQARLKDIATAFIPIVQAEQRERDAEVRAMIAAAKDQNDG